MKLFHLKSQQQQINCLNVLCNSNDNAKSIKNISHKLKLLLAPTETITALIDWNVKNFGQAHITPFTTNPLPKIFDCSSSQKFVQLIDNQPSTINNISPVTKYLLQQMLASEKK